MYEPKPAKPTAVLMYCRPCGGGLSLTTSAFPKICPECGSKNPQWTANNPTPRIPWALTWWDELLIAKHVRAVDVILSAHP